MMEKEDGSGSLSTPYVTLHKLICSNWNLDPFYYGNLM